MKTERSDPDHIGPVQWTIIGVGGIFILALALWAIQGSEYMYIIVHNQKALSFIVHI